MKIFENFVKDAIPTVIELWLSKTCRVERRGMKAINGNHATYDLHIIDK